MDKYELIKTLGTGSYGTVYLARSVADDRRYAVKSMKKGNRKREQCFVREARIMRQLQSVSYVARFYELIDEEHALHIVMEFAPQGDLLEDVLSSEEGLPESESARIFAQLVIAIQEIHAAGVLHRDVKPENIFLTEERNIVVGDFGLSTTFSSAETMRAMAGTLEYAAPETLLGSEVHGTEVDVWGLGVVLYVMLTSNYPFWGSSQKAVAQAIINEQPQLVFTMSRNARDLLGKLLEKKVENRITMVEVLEHPWLRREIKRERARRAAQLSSAAATPRDEPYTSYRKRWLQFVNAQAPSS